MRDERTPVLLRDMRQALGLGAADRQDNAIIHQLELGRKHADAGFADAEETADVGVKLEHLARGITVSIEATSPRFLLSLL